MAKIRQKEENNVLNLKIGFEYFSFYLFHLFHLMPDIVRFASTPGSRAFVRERSLFRHWQSAGHETTIDFHGSYQPPCALDSFEVFVYFGNLPARGCAMGYSVSGLTPFRGDCRTLIRDRVKCRG